MVSSFVGRTRLARVSIHSPRPWPTTLFPTGCSISSFSTSAQPGDCRISMYARILLSTLPGLCPPPRYTRRPRNGHLTEGSWEAFTELRVGSPLLHNWVGIH